MTVDYNTLVLALILTTAVILAVLARKDEGVGFTALLCVFCFQFCNGTCNGCGDCTCEMRNSPRVLDHVQRKDDTDG